MHEIFISYRRKDSQDATGRIHDHLDMYFGAEVTFRDIDSIPAGTSYPEVLDKALRNCRLVLAVVGPDWLNVSDHAGRRRLEDPNDLVRIELATALHRPVPIIPVLLSNATMPARDDLPHDLANLVLTQGVSIPASRSFGRGILELVGRIHNITNIHYEDYPSVLRECQRVGLVMVKSNFREDNTVLDEIEKSRDLIVVMNDGRSWIDSNREKLLGRLRDNNKTTRIVLYHPQSDFIKILIRKNKKPRARQISEIKGSFDILHASGAAPPTLSLRGHHGFNPYSLIVSDDYAFVSPYFFHEAGELPLLKFSSAAQHPLYRSLREDALRLFEDAEPIELHHFPKPRSARSINKATSSAISKS